MSVSSKDVMPFLWGSCGDEKIEEILWGFTLIDWRKRGLADIKDRWQSALLDAPVSRIWCVLKLLYSPDKIRGIVIKPEQRIVPLIMGRRIKEAAALAVRRLDISELHPLKVTYEEPLDPTCLLASLLVPVKDQWSLESLVLEPDNP